MSNAVMPISDYKNTCDVIREKIGKTDTIKSGELADKIGDVYEKGRKSWWADFQQQGNRKPWEYAFYGCSGFNGTLTLPENLTSVSRYAFYNCSSLTGVTLPKDLIALGERAFMNCSSLQNVILPGSVEHIGFNAFAGCSGLESFAILDNDNPEFETVFAGANEIGTSIFDGCTPNII